MRRARGRRGGGWLYALSGLGLLAVLVFSLRWAAAPLPRVPAVQRVPPPAAPLFPRGKGKIAIVLDDWGYNLRQVPAVLSIRRPLTVAILPNLPHSEQVARMARAHGHEVILHMPMEANDSHAPREAGTLLTGMPAPQVVELLDRSLASVPGARGISNHQGSKATSDPELMQAVLRELKRRRLYFLDSFVTQGSVCGEVARQVRVPFARRAVFLDNEGSAPQIRRQLQALAKSAARNGAAVGIGHDKAMTLDVLQRAIPALEEAGYTLVPVSDLAEEE